ncbi:MAG: hypothetical protein LBG31_03820, partial [Prevotellaceae bacterium]|nr:hypothetical protein [Prevotellaceae bacterium]
PANTKFNWCAYASDCPPFVIANNGTYTLQGTPPFILKATDGTSLTVEGNTLPASSLTIAAVTLTDKTECPSFFCAYTGSDLLRDETHLCGHRTTGAQNWEAWIKDTRDDELYRIVLMPDNHWWLAQNVKLASYSGKSAGSAFSNCSTADCGRRYTVAETVGDWGGTNGKGANIQGVCPSGWVLPVNADWVNFITAIEPTVSFTSYTAGIVKGVYTVNASVMNKLIKPDAKCGAGTDVYGWSATELLETGGRYNPQKITWWCGHETYAGNYNTLNDLPGSSNVCNYIAAASPSNDNGLRLAVRCFRQL